MSSVRAPATSAHGRSGPGRTLRVVAAAVALIVLPLGARGVAQGPQPKINEHGFTSSQVCGTCHVQIYQRWKDSLHAGATSDPIFRTSYMMAQYDSGGKAAKLCLRCHAPTSVLTGDANLDIDLIAEGITCDFCHSLKDVKLDAGDDIFVLDPGRVKRGPNKGGDVKVHDVEYSSLHSQARLCASCHEYRPNGVPIMTTYSEWKESPYAEEGKPCQYCHMPESVGEISKDVPGRRNGRIFDHHLAGGHSITELKKALALKIARVERKEDRMTVSVNVTNIGSGHRVPTGIPTRKLILYCEVRVPGGKMYKEKIIYEKAIFDKDGYELKQDSDIMLGKGVSIAKDNRIFPKETRKETFTFYLPSSREAKIAVWVDYLYEPLILQETEMRIEMNRDEKISAPGAVDR